MAGILGVILAGGQSRRMGGGDKALRLLGGASMLSRVVARLRPQADALVLNANGPAGRFAEFDLPVVPDSVEGHRGPLAGVLAGMDWAAAHRPGTQHIASAAADTPFFPTDMVSSLSAALGTAPGIAVARTASGLQPVFALWPVALRDDLRAFLLKGEGGKVSAWIKRHPHVEVTFPPLPGPNGPCDPFFNINTPEDLAAAEHLLALGGEEA